MRVSRRRGRERHSGFLSPTPSTTSIPEDPLTRQSGLSTQEHTRRELVLVMRAYCPASFQRGHHLGGPR